MNSTTFKASFPNLRKLAKSCTAWVCGSFLLFSGSAVSVSAQDYSSDLDIIISQLNTLIGQGSNLYNGNGPPLSENAFNSSIDALKRILNYNGSVSSRRNVLSILERIETNAVPALDDITDILYLINANTRRVSDLAANPWWATNSAFALSLQNFDTVFPDDAIANLQMHSFPQLLSIWSGRLQSTDVSPKLSKWYDSYWGTNAVRNYSLSNHTQAHLSRRSYTWFDWMSDVMRSNLTVAASAAFASSTNQIVADLADHGFDTESDDNPTNVPLPGYHDFIREAQGDTSVAQSSARFGGQLLTTKANALANQIKPQNADATITVLPEFQFGPIHTPEYTASLDSPITSACHSIMFFLWYVILFASLWHLASVEFAFYVNLGRNWTMSKGYLKESAE